MSPDATVVADWNASARRWPQGRRPMSIGVMIPISEQSAFGGTPRFADMVETTRTADAVGIDTAWFADHFVFSFPPDRINEGVWECWTTMAGVAATTERISIGALVACTSFRNPGVIAKMAESMDEISQGRFILGLGAGWHQPEYDQFGFPFDYRVSRFEESLEIIHPLLRTGAATYHGKFHQAQDAVNRPRGPRPDGPPILVGTSGHRMLRLTARFADAWNTVWHDDPAQIAPLMAAVDAACHDVGRDPKTLIRTAGTNVAIPGATGVRPSPITGSPEQLAEQIIAFRETGISHLVLGLDPCTPASLEWFGRVLELVDASTPD